MNPATIGFDARMWNHAGIGRYSRELMSAMLKKQRPYGFCLFGKEGLLEGLPEPAGNRVACRKAQSRIYGLAEQWEMGLAGHEVDLMHVPHFNCSVLGAKKLVVTIHDLIYLRDTASMKSGFLGRWYVDHLFRTIRRKAAAILTVSEYTKNDLLDYLPGLSAERVFVTPEAAAAVFCQKNDTEKSERIRRIYQLHKPFVLFVGTLKSHKNVPVLIKAMAQLRGERKCRHDLVLVGRSDLRNKPVFDLIQKYGEWVRHFESVIDEDLVTVYNLAECLAMPSLMEGFGLPVLEAMQCGTPVVLSRKTALEEVGGEAAIYCEPSSQDSVAEALYSVLSDSELRGTLAKEGLERARLFSWEKTAQRTLEVYQKVLS